MTTDGLSFPMVTPKFIYDSFGVELPQFLKVDVDGTEMSVLRGIFESGVGDRITFASVEHDDKPERTDYMLKTGFSLIKQDLVNNYYTRVTP